MCLLDQIKETCTHEKGIAVVDAGNNTKALFPQTTDPSSFSAEIEILRGKLAMVFVEASEKVGTTYILGDYIAQITDNDESSPMVKVKFNSGKEEAYDIVVAADGMRSKTRSLAFPPVELTSLGK